MATQPPDDAADSAPSAVRPARPGSFSSPFTASLLPDLPPISALFLIDFDVKAGYTILWRRQTPAPDQPGAPQLDGLVEYKSLPSGLHTVSEDLIYFVHDGDGGDGSDGGNGGAQGSQGYAGLSAFVNMPCDDEGARNARMIAVGVLVPLSFGRLGRAWRHADALKEMATQLAKDRQATAVLEKYWKQRGASDEATPTLTPGETPAVSPAFEIRPGFHRRQRSASDANALMPKGHKLSPYHPVWSLTSLLDTFGPLVFPIYRAALLRQRILISCHAPVYEICNFVYNISILSNIPLAVGEFISPSSPAHRLRPLFNIGVHDIPFLLQDHAAAKRSAGSAVNDDVHEDLGTGWVACTTDSILAVKDTLWDMLVTMPAPYSSQAEGKSWPKVECPRVGVVKATQRDLRRYRTLRSSLARFFPAPSASSPSSSLPSPSEAPETDVADTYLSRASSSSTESDAGFDSIVEPPSWSALAYNGFMWWASAGEQSHGAEQEERSHDNALLADFLPSHLSTSNMKPSRANTTGMVDSMSSLPEHRDGMFLTADDEESRKELAIIAYFHRLTTQMFSTIYGLIDDDRYISSSYSNSETPDGTATGSRQDMAVAGDESGDEEEDFLLRPQTHDDESIRISGRIFQDIGLDVWSSRDSEFVEELVKRYFGRDTYVEGKGIEICGVRVC